MKLKQAVSRVALVSGLAISSHAVAGGSMSADALKTLIVGNTITIEVVGKSATFHNYFDASGKALRDQGGRISEGTFVIKDDGMHFVTFDGKEACDRVTDNADGTYGRKAGNGAQ